jgi:hypothetical protein
MRGFSSGSSSRTTHPLTLPTSVMTACGGRCGTIVRRSVGHRANRHREHHEIGAAGGLDRVLRGEVDHPAIARDFEVGKRASETDRARDKILLARNEGERAPDEPDSAYGDLVEKRGH